MRLVAVQREKEEIATRCREAEESVEAHTTLVQTCVDLLLMRTDRLRFSHTRSHTYMHACHACTLTHTHSLTHSHTHTHTHTHSLTHS